MPLKRTFELPWPPMAGDRAPGWIMPSSLGRDFAIDELVMGRPIVFWCALRGDAAAMRAAAAAFQARFSELTQLETLLVGAYRGPAAPLVAIAQESPLDFPLLADEDGSVLAAFGLPLRVPPESQAKYFAFVLDANLRIRLAFESSDPQALAAQSIEFVRTLKEADSRRELPSFAPVLLIPDVLSPQFCRELIDIWETQGNEDSGFMREVDGRTVGASDYSHKIRRDHFIVEPTLRRRMNAIVGFRIRPEIRKAFNFEVTRFEDFKIACYDGARGGYFRPHRDNTTTGTAHRVWAMSINLNAGDYEGGHLRFPEHGPHLYRPATGEALIFSCSLLHEATDVTAGRRFVLLGFFYGEREAQMREQLARGAGDQYRAT